MAARIATAPDIPPQANGAFVIGRRALMWMGALAPALAASSPGSAGGGGGVHVERDYVRCRFGQLHLRRAGSISQRPPLLCFHQVPNSSQIYTEFLSMVATDRLAIAFDTPGYGMSDPATDPQTIGAYADAIEDGVAALGLAGAVDLLGYHTGAAIAAELTARGRLAVRRVMLVAVPVF
ncbi:MAG TPA: alpha/beta fold hydrolase, partial [Allosphingosinicella sp.]|nr:alpha/beta fold hydrolase [Allosphingosinicella sp.]